MPKLLYNSLTSWPSLSALAYALPEWVWQYSAYKHVSAFGGDIEIAARRLGMPFSHQSVYDDLSCLRRYGNKGAHASRYLNGGRLEPDANVVVSVFRLALSFAVWQTRFSRL